MASSRTIGAFCCRELALFLGADRAIAADDVEVARHERERFLFAPLQPAQAADRVAIRGIAGELIAADPLDRDDRAAGDEFCGKRDSIGGALALRRRTAQRYQSRCRAAVRAGHGFGVEPPIVRIVIFGAAIATQRKGRHGRRRPDRTGWR